MQDRSPARFVDASGARGALVVLGTTLVVLCVLASPQLTFDTPRDAGSSVHDVICRAHEQIGDCTPEVLGTVPKLQLVQWLGLAMVLALAVYARRDREPRRVRVDLLALAIACAGASPILVLALRLSSTLDGAIVATVAVAAAVVGLRWAWRRGREGPGLVEQLCLLTLAIAVLSVSTADVVATLKQPLRELSSASVLVGPLGTIGLGLIAAVPLALSLLAFLPKGGFGSWDHLRHR